jgi:hypothetical protein
MATSDTSPPPTHAPQSEASPSPTQALHALKYWLPALVAVAGAGWAGGVYVSGKADRADLKELADKVSKVTESLTKLDTKIQERDERTLLQVAEMIRGEVERTRQDSRRGPPHSVPARAWSLQTRVGGVP